MSKPEQKRAPPSRERVEELLETLTNPLAELGPIDRDDLEEALLELLRLLPVSKTYAVRHIEDAARRALTDAIRRFAHRLEEGADYVAGGAIYREFQNGNVSLESDLCLRMHPK
jgi:hypothetical protein